MHFEGIPEQVTALMAALVAAQAEFPAIPKTKTAGAGSFSYKYAPLVEIQEKIRPILAKHDLAVIHPLERIDGKQIITTLILHKGGGRAACAGLTVPESLKIQEQGSYITYGSRYGYSSVLGIASEDENENHLGRGPRPKPPRQDGVAQDGRAPLVAPKSRSGDSGSIPDPSLPTKQDRASYRSRLNEYRAHVEDDALEQFLLRASGASEVRLVTKAQWKKLLTDLDAALLKGGPSGLQKLVAGEKP